ncbi:hypothetical protein [Mycolicibacterium pallens]|uniref:Secreted protein n=1 Tax=Mycolicibacterium pallens TaxID=370524 RepID=A0ABX8VSJ4_9MYCO|nr:hypothetical protein [Mycolicibacterium pallens]QYL19163.1 hypothetical protein K0O64_12125 [Mycolicibacterium pallens]
MATATVAISIGGAGIFFTWLTGKQARDDARASAREAREQERLENAYIGMLDMAERVGQWVRMVYPLWDTVPPRPVPAELPSLAEQAHTQALVNAFGSGDVRVRMKDWQDVVQDVLVTVQQIQWEEADRERYSEESPRRTLERLRGSERIAREALTDQVAVELGHRIA